MFQEKTVFILGAGASWHYGYPTGSDLIKKVIQFADDLVQKLQNNPYSIEGIHILDVSKYPRKNLIEDCEKISARLRQTNALIIDYFLEQNQDLQKIGKLLIAWILIEDEVSYHSNTSKVMDKNKNLEVGKESVRQDWYRFIIYKLLSDIDINTPAELTGKNNVCFITFNYDVSLEYRIYTALKEVNFLKSSPESIASFMEDEGRFIHVYGQIRPISEVLKVPQMLTQGHDWYNKKMQILNAANEAANRIRIIPELKEKNDKVLELARKKIAEADRVYILGYGFDPQNNNRIGLNNLSLASTVGGIKKVFFTNFEDKDSINKRINSLWAIEQKRGAMPFYRGGPNLMNYIPNSITGHHNTYDRSTQDVYTALESDFDFL